MYDNVKDDEDIVPKELVETGMRVQKKASQRKKELDEDIKTKEQMLKIVDGMIKDVEQGVETSE